MAPERKVVALVSGGLDSCVALAWAIDQELTVERTITFYYGQTHLKELDAARRISAYYNIPNWPYSIPMLIQANDVGHLLKSELDPVEAQRTVLDQHGERVSATFVPGRNIIFLAYAGSIVDSLGLKGIVIGVNAVDYSGYPDCRPQFITYMQAALTAGLRHHVQIFTPVLALAKSDIIRLGDRLAAPMGLTWSCYKGDERPCGKCPSCTVRAKGFNDAMMMDPAPH